MLNKKFFLVTLCLVVYTLFSKENTIDFFGKNVTRRYYQNEFFNILSYKDIDFKYSYSNLEIESIRSSKSIELTTSNIQITVFNKKTDALLLKFKTISNKGAIEIDTSIPVPKWTKSLSLWILNHNSEMEGYIYIKYPERLVRYKIGDINHIKWKRFNIDIEKMDNGVIKRIKLFNRNKRSNPYFDNTIAIASNIMFISKYKDDNETEYIREVNPTSLIGSNVNKGILKIITDKPSYYRFEKGLLVRRDEFIVFDLEANNPYVIEIIGGLVDNRKRLFSLHLNIEPKEERHFIIIRVPEDLYSFSEVIAFWGIGITPVKNRIDITIKNIKISSDI